VKSLDSEGERSQYPSGRRLGGPQNWAGPFREEKNKTVLLMLGIEPRVLQLSSQWPNHYTDYCGLSHSVYKVSQYDILKFTKQNILGMCDVSG
jgi:hypothetical protein